MSLTYEAIFFIYLILVFFNLAGFIKNWRREKTDFIKKGCPRPFEGYVLTSLFLSPFTVWYWWYDLDELRAARKRSYERQGKC